MFRWFRERFRCLTNDDGVTSSNSVDKSNRSYDIVRQPIYISSEDFRIIHTLGPHLNMIDENYAYWEIIDEKKNDI